MKSIDIDEEVFSHLEKHVKGFFETPNTTLRRLLSIADAPTFSKQTTGIDAELDTLYAQAKASLGRSKAPKASLKLLVKSGYIKDGDKLSLIDYQGNLVQKLELR